MKKLICFLVLSALTFLAFSGAARAEAGELTGEWYGTLLSRPITLTLYEDGAYVLSVDGGSQAGTWEREGDALFMDRGTPHEQTLYYDGRSLTTDDVVFTRERVEAFSAALERRDAGLEEFQGTWTCVMISFFGETLSLEENEETTLTIRDTHMTYVDLGETKEYDGEFVGGELRFIDAPADSEAVTITVRLHEDGRLSLTIPFGGEDGIVSYFVRQTDTDTE